jgi:serine phosphatase RsbU (regulator of sigma subunit)
MRHWWQAAEWWRMPLIGVAVGGPISLTASLFLASYGGQGPYGGFWRLVFAGLAASVPIFAVGGLFFAPVEIWLTQRARPRSTWYAGVLRSGTLGLAGFAGAHSAYVIVVRLLAAPPPSTLLPVLLTTYPLIGAIIGLAYTLYHEFVRQLRISTQLTQEMRVARSIQQGLFPRQYPQVPGYTMAAHCQPAHETGGDFYDFVQFEDGRLGLVIGDVAGKGMPAALLMANARSIWRAEASNERGPGETLQRVNRSLHHDINSNGFVTLLYALLDPPAGRLCLASAGHPLPLLCNDAGLREIEVYGLPLGLQPDATYEEVQVSLAPGDTLLLYTDGVTEAMNSARELFGVDRLVALMQHEGHRPAGALAERVLSVACTFGGQAGQADDMTVMVLQPHLET